MFRLAVISLCFFHFLGPQAMGSSVLNPSLVGFWQETTTHEILTYTSGGTLVRSFDATQFEDGLDVMYPVPTPPAVAMFANVHDEMFAVRYQTTPKAAFPPVNDVPLLRDNRFKTIDQDVIELLRRDPSGWVLERTFRRIDRTGFALSVLDVQQRNESLLMETFHGAWQTGFGDEIEVNIATLKLKSGAAVFSINVLSSDEIILIPKNEEALPGVTSLYHHALDFVIPRDEVIRISVVEEDSSGVTSIKLEWEAGVSVFPASITSGHRIGRVVPHPAAETVLVRKP